MSTMVYSHNSKTGSEMSQKAAGCFSWDSTHGWEEAKRKDAQQTSFATSTVTNNDELSGGKC